jgi:hypothetical protein
MRSNFKLGLFAGVLMTLVLAILPNVPPVWAQTNFVPDTAQNYQVTTATNGVGWVQLTSVGCQRLTVVAMDTNAVAIPLEVRRGSTATFGFPLPGNASKTFRGLRNASDLYVRRLDLATNAATFTYEIEGGGL